MAPRSDAFIAVSTLAATFVPSMLVTLGAVGLSRLELQKDIDEIWMRKSSQYAKDIKYTEDVRNFVDEGNSLLLAIAVPRAGGNMVSSSHLLEMRDRMAKTQKVTVTVDGMTFTFDDVCANMAGAYRFPCYRVSVIDCFKEGQYDFTALHKQAFQAMVLNQALPPLKLGLIKSGLASTPQAMGGCAHVCTVDGQAAAIVGVLGVSRTGPPGTWESNTACSQCFSPLVAPTPGLKAMQDTVYYQTLRALMAQLNGLPPSTFSSTSPQALDAMVTTLLATGAGLTGKSPYEWTLGVNFPPRGGSRPSLVDASNNFKTDAEVLQTASATCYAWDEGQALPSVNQYLTMGSYTPTSFKATLPATSILTGVEALQNIFLLIRPNKIVKRVASSTAAAARPGGALKITEEQAKRVMSQFKVEMEKVWSEGWDNANAGGVEFTAWSDDAGAGGSTQDMLEEVTMKAVPQAIAFFVIVVFLSAIFFISTSSPKTESRCLLAFLGALYVICAVISGIGLLAFFGIKWNITMSYTMPFVMVGILCDDMYMIILSLDDTDAALPPDERFVKAMRNVGVPITVTSAVNFGVFLTLFVASDLPAVYDTGATGMVCTAVSYLAIMGSFSGLVYLDLVRRTAQRWDFGLCCLRVQGAPLKSEGKQPPSKIYQCAFRPIFRTIVGRIVVFVIALALLIVAIVGLTNMEVGLDLQDLYPSGKQSHQFISNRMKHFPVWPSELFFGELEYWKPEIQLKMAKAWEDVISTSYAAPGLQTAMLWTAMFANWGMPSSVPAFSATRSSSPCNSSNTFTSGRCAEKLFADLGGPSCTAVLRENTIGLKTITQNGMCFPGPMVGKMDTKTYCPVFDLPNAQAHAACVKRWYQYTRHPAVVSPGIVMEADGITPKVPIRLSKAGGSLLYMHRLFTTDDYVKMMEETRKFADDDKSMHSWMDGIAFSYWEQYLTIVGFMWSIGAWASGAGFVVSLVFLYLALTVGGFGRPLPRLVCCLLGSLLITVVLVASMITVWGWMSIFKVQLSAFSAMAVLFASGFAVEYAVHVVHHFLESQEDSAAARVDFAMSFLFKPMILAALSSLLSVFVMAFSGISFVTRFFFIPLILVVLVTYFYGVVLLPCLLACMGCMPHLAKAEAQGTKEEGEVAL